MSLFSWLTKRVYRQQPARISIEDLNRRKMLLEAACTTMFIGMPTTVMAKPTVRTSVKKELDADAATAHRALSHAERIAVVQSYGFINSATKADLDRITTQANGAPLEQDTPAIVTDDVNDNGSVTDANGIYVWNAESKSWVKIQDRLLHALGGKGGKFFQDVGDYTYRDYLSKSRDIVSVLDYMPDEFRDDVRQGTYTGDVSRYVQKAVEAAVERSAALDLSGRFYIGKTITARLSSGVMEIRKSGQFSELIASENIRSNALLTFTGTGNVSVIGIVLDGRRDAVKSGDGDLDVGLLDFRNEGVVIVDRTIVRNCCGSGITMGASTTGVIQMCQIFACRAYGIACRGIGTRIASNTIDGAGAVGIYIYGQATNDIYSATSVIGNVVKNISDDYPNGTGQRGNGIQVYKANNVIISCNYIYRCDWSGVRVNSGTMCSVIGNNINYSGEVGIFFEFSHEYGLINSNFVRHFGISSWNKGASRGVSLAGIVATNLEKYGGRSSVITSNIVMNGPGAGIFAEADGIISENLVDGCQWGIVSGTQKYTRDNIISNNRIMDRYALEWSVGSTYKAGDRVIFKGNIYVASKPIKSGGADPSVAGSRSDTLSGWKYERTSTPLRVGIMASREPSAYGATYIINNVVTDWIETPICGQDGNPRSRRSWVTGSKVFLEGNIPGVDSAYLPPTAIGGSTVYEIDTGIFKRYNAIINEWTYERVVIAKKAAKIVMPSGGAKFEVIHVPGVVVGDFVQATRVGLLPGVDVSAVVDAVNQVTVYFRNATAREISLPEGDIRVRVVKI